jgi:NAD+ synthase
MKAAPTDGLFGDDRSDEDQIGASYPELEWAMAYVDNGEKLTKRQHDVLEIYQKLNKQNQHKMQPIPVCIIPDDLR